MIRWLIGLLLIAVGLSALFEVNLFRFIVPVLLIWLGWMVISKDQNHHRSSVEQEVDANNLNESYVFSGTRKKIKSVDFTGGKVVAVFGGIELDLREVKTKSKTIQLETTAVFGGLRLRIPKTWEVESTQMRAVLGGVEDMTDTKIKKDVKLLISGAAVFGGVEVSS